MAILTSTITLKAGGEDFQAYVAEHQGGGPGILLLHAWWGLKPFFKQVCDRLAEEGFIVLAPDLRKGQIAQTIEEAEALMQKSDGKLVRETVMAAKDYLLHIPHLTGRTIGVIGFSMGGDLALHVAEQVPDRVGAVALFYGAGDADFSKVQAKVMGHFSDVDEWEDIKWVRAMEEKMKAAGVDVSMHIYPGLPHWFVEEDRPEYDAAGAELAWQRTTEFLKSNLSPSSA